MAGIDAEPVPRLRAMAPWGAFAACSGIWGSTFLFISIGNDTVPPVWAATLRLGLAALLLAALARVVGQRLPRGAGLFTAARYGVFAFGVNFPLLYWGEKVVPSGLAAVIFATIPLSTALFARASGLERLSAPKVGGALLGLAGVVAIFSDQVGGEISPLAVLALLAGATSAAFANVVVKRGPHVPAIAMNAVGAAVGFLCCLAVSLAVGERHAVPATFDELLPILYLTLAGSVGAYVLVVWLIGRWEATRVSFITLIIPVVALALGALVRDERVTSVALLGAGMVLAGVSVALSGERRPAQPG